MTYRPTEYQAMKKLLTLYRDEGTITGDEMNGMIRDSCAEAYKKMPTSERMSLSRNKNILIRKFKGMSDRTALELLAAIGDVLNNNGRVNDG